MNPEFDHYNTLFLDRDGVINKRLEGRYVSSIEGFQFVPGVLEALARFNDHFTTIVIVTNQQGVGKGIMTQEELEELHNYMLEKISDSGGRIDQVYSCPHLSIFNPLCRKPNPGMALQAKEDFPEIEFDKSIMVGDSPSDIVFGHRLGMYTVGIGTRSASDADNLPDLLCDSLISFSKKIMT